MNSYPRVKKFEFEIERVLYVPAFQTGRLDLVAIEVYGDYRFYKVLAAANNIRISGGYRVGIRPNEDAIASELERKGVPLDEIPDMVNKKILNSRPNNLDWDTYNNISYGYVSDVSDGIQLLVPTFTSADAYLQRYEYIELTLGDENN